MLRTKSLNDPTAAFMTIFQNVRDQLFERKSVKLDQQEDPLEKERNKVLSVLFSSVELGARLEEGYIKVLQGTISEIAQANLKNAQENKPSTFNRDIMQCLIFIKMHDDRTTP